MEAIFRARKHLIFSVLFFFLYLPFAKSQISNQLAYKSIVIGHLSKDTNKVGKFTGILADDLRAHGNYDPASKKSLNFPKPTIEYKNLEGTKFERTISIDLVYKDSTDQFVGLTKVDTLDRKDIKEAREVEEKELRGPDPRFIRKFLIPIAGIGSGIAGIISLFYIRSSQR